MSSSVFYSNKSFNSLENLSTTLFLSGTRLAAIQIFLFIQQNQIFLVKFFFLFYFIAPMLFIYDLSHVLSVNIFTCISENSIQNDFSAKYIA